MLALVEKVEASSELRGRFVLSQRSQPSISSGCSEAPRGNGAGALALALALWAGGTALRQTFFFRVLGAKHSGTVRPSHLSCHKADSTFQSVDESDRRAARLRSASERKTKRVLNQRAQTTAAGPTSDGSVDGEVRCGEVR